VRYALREGKLYRDYWMVLDAQLEPQPQSKELLSGVKSFRLRFMNDGRNWQDGWPPPSPSNPPDESWLRWRPIAVEVTLELDDWGTLTRLIEVPDDHPPAARRDPHQLLIRVALAVVATSLFFDTALAARRAPAQHGTGRAARRRRQAAPPSPSPKTRTATTPTATPGAALWTGGSGERRHARGADQRRAGQVQPQYAAAERRHA
jgi:hypothetical protein